MQTLNAEQLRAIVTIQSQISDVELSIQAVMDTVIEGARIATDAIGGMIEVPEGNEMVTRAVGGAAKGHIGIRSQVAHSLSGLCFSLGESLYCEDARTDGRVDRVACERVSAISLVCIPLRYHGEIIGVLKVYNSFPDAFAGSDIEILEILAVSISSKLGQSIAFEHEQEISLHDALTGLLNRRAFDVDLLGERERHSRYGHLAVLCLFDLDGFKQVNDTLGHTAGDQVLKVVANDLRRVRPSDRTYRLGGDEFALILIGLSVAQAHTVSVRIGEAIDASVGRFGVGISTGIVQIDSKLEAHEIFNRADAELYAIKREHQSDPQRDL